MEKFKVELKNNKHVRFVRQIFVSNEIAVLEIGLKVNYASVQATSEDTIFIQHESDPKDFLGTEVAIQWTDNFRIETSVNKSVIYATLISEKCFRKEVVILLYQ